MFTSVLLSVLVSLNAVAGDIQVAFEALKNSAADYEPTGQVCEQVARLQFAEKYNSDQYEITGGISYNVQKRTIGELDLVIVDRQTHAVVLVGEVKCWKNLKDALDKAHDQRVRFVNALRKSGDQIVFDSEDKEVFHAEQFKDAKFISIAQQGATESGFDVDLGYTLRELMQLRGLLLNCQSQNRCPRPPTYREF
jgi:hypothetical protein